MTDLRQAAQQALEALIDAANVLSAPMFADAVDALRTALEQQAEPVAVYGYCPYCGAEGAMRERRPNGNDKCTNGHTYPSRTAAPVQPLLMNHNGAVRKVHGYPPAPPQQQAEPPEWLLIKNILDEYGLQAISFVAEWKAAQQQAEPVSHAVIVGALFDFIGWLTTRKKRLILSSTDNASPAADAIKVFAEMRGLSLDDALVQDWQNYTTPLQQQAELVGEVIDERGEVDYISYVPPVGTALYTTPPQRQWVGLTDEDFLEACQIAERGNYLLALQRIQIKLKEKNSD